MTYSFIEVTGTGSTNVVSVPFPYIDKSHVKVFVDGAERAAGTLTWPSPSTIQLPDTASSLAGRTIRVQRLTPPNAPMVAFKIGALDPDDLDLIAKQFVYRVQEVEDANLGIGTDVINARNDVITRQGQVLALRNETLGFRNESADLLAQFKKLFLGAFDAPPVNNPADPFLPGALHYALYTDPNVLMQWNPENSGAWEPAGTTIPDGSLDINKLQPGPSGSLLGVPLNSPTPTAPPRILTRQQTERILTSIGDIKPTLAVIPPPGWQFLDGSYFDISANAELFDAISAHNVPQFHNGYTPFMGQGAVKYVGFNLPGFTANRYVFNIADRSPNDFLAFGVDGSPCVFSRVASPNSKAVIAGTFQAPTGGRTGTDYVLSSGYNFNSMGLVPGEPLNAWFSPFAVNVVGGVITAALPDFRGRVPVGRDNMGGTLANRITQVVSGIRSWVRGAAGGDERMQQHNHSIPFNSTGGGGGGGSLLGGSSSTPSGNAGAGNSQNVQPSIIVNWIIYTGVYPSQ